MLTSSLELLLAVALVLANGFFVASEFAIVKMRPSRLEELAAQSNKRARIALSISRQLDAYLSANQLGITLASLALGWVGEDAFGRLLEPLVAESKSAHAVALAASFAIITFLHTVVGELAPKSLAIQKTERTALWTAIPLRVFYLAAFPIVWTLNAAATGVLHLVGLTRVKEVDVLHSATELRLVLQHVAIDPGARKLIDRVFDYVHRSAGQVMILRPDVVVLEPQKTFEENLSIALTNQFTRYPLVDRQADKVLGYIHIKDLFSAFAAGKKPDLRSIVREPIYCNEDARVEEVRREIQRRGIHLVIVQDRKQAFAGILTLEDLVEEFVGEIRDEQDAGEIPPLVCTPDGGFEADGRVTLDVLKREVGLALEPSRRNVETLGGYIAAEIGGIPYPGASVVAGDFRLIVLAVRGRRITRVRGERVSPRAVDRPAEE
jgi:CBS domain containing-hemolysin-like protein